MLEQLVLSKEMNDVLVDVSGIDNELTGFFLGEMTEGGIALRKAYVTEGTSANTRMQVGLPTELHDRVEEDPARYCAVFLHMHTRKDGDSIQRCGPYWTLGRNEGDEEGRIVDGKFVINSNEAGDDKALETFSKALGVNYALFVHPQFGSEGQTMARDKVQLTAFKYNPSNTGKVEEIPLQVIE